MCYLCTQNRVCVFAAYFCVVSFYAVFVSRKKKLSRKELNERDRKREREMYKIVCRVLNQFKFFRPNLVQICHGIRSERGLEQKRRAENFFPKKIQTC